MLCSWESPFANCLAGAPDGDYLVAQSCELQGGARCRRPVHGLTSCPPIKYADRRRASTSATQYAIGIMPVAVSLSNAPPTATPSSVMGPGSLTFRGNDLRRALLVASAIVASFAFRVVGAAGEFLLVEVFALVSGVVFFVVEVLILVFVVVEVLVVGLIRQVVLIDVILVVEVFFVVETVVRLV